MNYDLIIIGAGPAGMAAAIESAKHNLKVIVLDEQPRSGGQIYRNVSQQQVQNKSILGPDYQAGKELVTDFENLNSDSVHGATVWQIAPEGKVYFSAQGTSRSVTAKHVLIATGAQERAMPIPGWTTPGVMTVGSAQVLMKTSTLGAQGAVFAGSGPLLYLSVSQYLNAGLKVKAVLDTTERKNYIKSIKHWRGALSGISYILKGLKLLWQIRNAGVPFIRNVTDIEAISGNNGQLATVRYSVNDQTQTLDSQHLFLHQGVIPQVNLPMASGCEYKWDNQNYCWSPILDQWGQTSQSKIFIAGDGRDIGGAVSAKLRGQLTAMQIAHLHERLTNTERDQQAQRIQQILQKELAFRPFIDALYRPADSFRTRKSESDIVCRCEEVTVGDIKDAVDKGCLGVNQLKSFTRCGMGPCQGRQCGNQVSEMVSYYSGKSVEDCGYFRLRAPVKPLNLAELASLAE